MSQRLDDGGGHLLASVPGFGTVGLNKPPIEPINQIALGDVAAKKEQVIGGLIEPAVAHRVAGQGALLDILKLGTGPLRFLKTAVLECPIALQLGAHALSFQAMSNFIRADAAVLLHVPVC